MPRVNNDKLLNDIQVARANEKVAIAEAKRKYEALVERDTIEYRSALLEAVRLAVAEGLSIRQIGFAYGSSDANTAKRVIAEAMATVSTSTTTTSETNQWAVVGRDGDTFTLVAYSLGGNGTGTAMFEIDDDGKNITVIEGDFWIGMQLYRLGLVEDVMEVVNGL